MIAIRGATTSGNPWDVTAGTWSRRPTPAATIAGATTTVANTLVVAAIATSLPDASNGTANFSAWTNSNLSSLTERTDNTVPPATAAASASPPAEGDARSLHDDGRDLADGRDEGDGGHRDQAVTANTTGRLRFARKNK